jgi:sarcosine oxidase subunit gamma
MAEPLPRNLALDAKQRLAPSPRLTIHVAPPASRLILRAREASVARAGQALGVELPRVSCRANVAGERAALWLGPDEWLVLMPPSDDASTMIATLRAALGDAAHAAVDVGHRQTAILVEGEAAAELLSAGCPLDLARDAFPVAMCTRTLLAKTEIVLWRTAAASFRLEVARSFARYAWAFLAEAAREFEAA